MRSLRERVAIYDQVARLNRNYFSREGLAQIEWYRAEVVEELVGEAEEAAG